jgi:predicted negative regulator of RcsB-dependent stress response
VRSEVRHQLKEDRFATTVGGTYSWAVEHRVNLIGGVAVAAVIIAIALGWFFYSQNREEKASLELGKAMRTLQAPILPPGVPPQPGMDETYGSLKDRATAAEKKFRDIGDHYGHTGSGKMARYMAAVTRLQSGDNAGAEPQLRQLADSRDRDMAALAKMALASIYLGSNRESQAMAIYKDLMDHPTATVSKLEAEMQMAQAYEAKQPQQARQIYLDIQKEDPTGPAAQMAMSKLAALK